MSVSEPGYPLVFRYKGIIDFFGLVTEVKKWYYTKAFELHEKKVKHKQGFGFEAEYEYTGFRRETEYWRRWIDLHLHIYDGIPVEVEINGVKKKAFKGRIFGMITAKVEMDYTERFSKNSFTRRLRKFLNMKVIYEDIDEFWTGTTHNVQHDLLNTIKTFLKTHSAGSEYPTIG